MKWLGVKEIAQYMGISKETVYRMLKRDDIPAHRIGKIWVFSTDEIDEWILSGEAAKAQDPKFELYGDDDDET